MKEKFVLLFLLGLWTAPRALFVENMTTAGLSAETLAGLLAGDNISISNVVLTADPRGVGRYRDGIVEAQGNEALHQGTLFSTGMVESLNSNTNTSDEMSGTFPRLGNAELTALLPPGSITADASVLEFDFFVAGEGDATVSLLYLFGSDEYDEWAGSIYNDVFGVFIDGTNIATLPGTVIPVTISNVNATNNSDWFRGNDRTNGIPTPFATEMDGFTVPLSAEFTTTGGSMHHFMIAIADAEDFRYDSWIFVGQGCLSASTAATVPEPSTSIMLAIGLLLMGLCARLTQLKKTVD